MELLSETEYQSFAALLQMATPTAETTGPESLDAFLQHLDYPKNTDVDKEVAVLPRALVQGTQTADAAVNTASSFLQSARRSVKSKRKKKDVLAPKKPRSSYIVFLDRHREKLRRIRPEMAMKDITSVLAKTWRSVPDHEVETCKSIARSERQEYELARNTYLSEQKPSCSDSENNSPDLSDSSGSGSIRPKAKRRKKDKAAPRKGRSAFILFLMDFRNANKQADNSSKAFSELSKKVSSAWAGLTDAERQPYLDRAAEEAANYKAAKAAYEASKSASLACQAAAMETVKRMYEQGRLVDESIALQNLKVLCGLPPHLLAF